MKQLSVPKLAFLFAGCFLGAGFVSGQELWQFFGCFGGWGFAGLAVSAVLFALCGILLIRLAQLSGVQELDETVIRWNIPWLRHTMAFLQCLFLFSVVAIMVAGGGALLHQLFPTIPAWCASLAFGVLVILLALRGLDGVAAAFSVCVPGIVLATVAFAIAALAHFGVEQFTLSHTGSDNPMLPCWWVAAVTYVAYNIFGSIGILTPFGDLVPSRKRVYQGILLGTFLLVLIAVSVLASLSFYLPAVHAHAGAGVPDEPQARLRLRPAPPVRHLRRRPVLRRGAGDLPEPALRTRPPAQDRLPGGHGGCRFCRQPGGLRRPHQHHLPRLWLPGRPVPGAGVLQLDVLSKNGKKP